MSSSRVESHVQKVSDIYDLINNLRAELLPLAKVNKVKVGEEYFCIYLMHTKSYRLQCKMIQNYADA